MKRKLKKFFAWTLAVCLLMTVVNVSMVVRAEGTQSSNNQPGGGNTPAVENRFEIVTAGQTIEVINKNQLKYSNGLVTITYGSNDLQPELSLRTGTTDTLNEFNIGSETTVKFTFEVNEGCTPELRIDGNDIAVENNVYTYTFSETQNHSMFQIKINGENGSDNPPANKLTGIFNINGVDISYSSEEPAKFAVPDDFDFSNLKVIVKELDGTKYDDAFASGTMYDDENRDAFEIMIHHKDESVLQLGILFHNDSIGNINKYPGFYLTQMTLVKENYRGVGVETENVPDMYDFQSFQKVDLAVTTPDKPSKITTYYGDDTIKLSSDTDKAITKIELGAGIPVDAVTIDNTAKTVKVNSNYYNQIPLKVTLSDQTVGYMQVERIGLEIAKYQWVGLGEGEAKFINHGPGMQGSNIPVSYYGKSIMTATFYHAADEDYNDYDMIATVKLSDGTKKTEVVKGIGTVTCRDTDLAGSDYIVWSGDEINKDDPASVYPVSVSVTAVKANATTGSTFGGATFGSGAGVTWVRPEK